MKENDYDQGKKKQREKQREREREGTKKRNLKEMKSMKNDEKLSKRQ